MPTATPMPPAAPTPSRPSPVTVLMPIYDRLRYLRHALSEGLWERLDLQLVCDGSPPDVRAAVEALARQHPHLTVHAYADNRGLACANRTGIERAPTPLVTFCDDDDVLVHPRPFFDEAERLLADDVLFVSMPTIHAFTEQLANRVQYDRRNFDRWTAAELLAAFVQTGEMQAFNAGTVYRTEQVRAVPVEDLFRVSEDFVRIVRLCARHPDKIIRIASTGRYLRLLHGQSLSAAGGYGLDKIAMHLLAMGIGGYHLLTLDLLTLGGLQGLLHQRGGVLQQAYGRGQAAAAYIAEWVAGQPAAPQTHEALEVHAFLEAQHASMPEEIHALRLHRQHHPVVSPVGCVAEPQATPASDVPAKGAGAEQPTVTVVIPCYNYARYLPDAVRSVVEQSYPAWDLVIVDDGSTDDSLAVARRLQATYAGWPIRVVTQPNAGQPAVTRNRGIREGDGPYIVCLDADDKLAPTFLATCVAMLEAAPEVGFVYTHRQDFDGADHIAPAGPYDLERLKRRNYIPYCAVYRRAMWDSVGGYRDNVRGVEDWDFWLAAAAEGFTGRRVPEPLFFYRRHDTGVFQDAMQEAKAKAAQVIVNNWSLYDTEVKLAATAYLRAQQDDRVARPCPDDVRRHYEAAVARGDWTVARQLAEQAVQQAADDPQAHVWLAHCERQAGRWQAALDAVQRSIQAGETPEALRELADICAVLGEADRAAQIRAYICARHPGAVPSEAVPSEAAASEAAASETAAIPV